ncbi:hypothetical protein BH23CHL8_BH23CHL8_31980 [soil metagenome]
MGLGDGDGLGLGLGDGEGLGLGLGDGEGLGLGDGEGLGLGDGEGLGLGCGESDVQRSASLPTSSRPPVTVTPAMDVVGRTVSMTRSRSCRSVRVTSRLAHRASAPVTWGVAMLVPEYDE